MLFFHSNRIADRSPSTKQYFWHKLHAKMLSLLNRTAWNNTSGINSMQKCCLSSESNCLLRWDTSNTWLNCTWMRGLKSCATVPPKQSRSFLAWRGKTTRNPSGICCCSLRLQQKLTVIKLKTTRVVKLSLVSILSLTIAGLLKSLKHRIAHDRPIAEECFHIIADDRPIAEKFFHIIADDRWQHFQRSGDRELWFRN